MNKGMEAQALFFQQIKEKLEPHTSLVDEIENALSLSQDSAYRRIRGEKELSFSEIQKLTAKYGVSADLAFNAAADNIVNFRYNPLDHKSFTMIDYLAVCRDTLKKMADSGSGDLIYAAKDIPLFHYFYFDEIAAFKMFVWQKTLLGFPEFADVSFSLKKVDEDIISIGKKAALEYNRIPSIELWNQETINSLLRQIQFYAESHLFMNPEEAILILDKVEEYIEHLRRMTAEGMKFMPNTQTIQGTGKFQFFNNEVVLCDNTILGEHSGRMVTYITHNSFNFLSTFNEHICQRTKGWMENLIRKSTQISTTGEKDRNHFFGNLQAQVKKTRERVKFIVAE
ncbi:MAG: hypothetical protein NTX03_02535 [Bacteroidetes bacterium]|nr:hypothetical protein [Bacteroidota bacterium]